MRTGDQTDRCSAHADTVDTAVVSLNSSDKSSKQLQRKSAGVGNEEQVAAELRQTRNSFGLIGHFTLNDNKFYKNTPQQKQHLNHRDLALASIRSLTDEA